MANLSNYIKTTVAQGTVPFSSGGVGYNGSTGPAVAYSTYYGFPQPTTGLDGAGFDGALATAIIIGSTYAALQVAIGSASSANGLGLNTSSGWAVATSTATGFGYSTSLMSLSFDLYRTPARYIGFIASVPSSSAVVAAITVSQYADRKYAQSVGLYSAGSTVFVSPTSY